MAAEKADCCIPFSVLALTAVVICVMCQIKILKSVTNVGPPWRLFCSFPHAITISTYSCSDLSDMAKLNSWGQPWPPSGHHLTATFVATSKQTSRPSKRGSQLDRPDQPLSYSEMETILWCRFHQAWKLPQGGDQGRRPSMPGMITAVGNLQAENGPLPPPVTRPQVKLSYTNEWCPCDIGRQTPEHFLQDYLTCEMPDIKPGQRKWSSRRSCTDQQQHWERLQTSSCGLGWLFEHGLGTQNKQSRSQEIPLCSFICASIYSSSNLCYMPDQTLDDTHKCRATVKIVMFLSPCYYCTNGCGRVWCRRQNQTAEVSQGHQEKCRISFSMSVLAALVICYAPGNIGLWTQRAVDTVVQTCIYISCSQCGVAKSNGWSQSRPPGKVSYFFLHVSACSISNLLCTRKHWVMDTMGCWYSGMDL